MITSLHHNNRPTDRQYCVYFFASAAGWWWQFCERVFFEILCARKFYILNFLSKRKTTNKQKTKNVPFTWKIKNFYRKFKLNFETLNAGKIVIYLDKLEVSVNGVRNFHYKTVSSFPLKFSRNFRCILFDWEHKRDINRQKYNLCTYGVWWFDIQQVIDMEEYLWFI